MSVISFEKLESRVAGFRRFEYNIESDAETFVVGFFLLFCF